MNRREFSAGLACTLGAAAMGLPGLAWAQKKPEEGNDYRALDKRVPVQARWIASRRPSISIQPS